MAALAGVLLMTAVGTQAASAEEWPYGCPDGYRESKLNFKSIALPGKPDVNLQVHLCLYDQVGSYKARADINYASTTGGDGWGTKFNYIYAEVWVQKNDVNKCTGVIHPEINTYSQGWNAGSCTWKSANTTGVSVDGKLVYDVADDGKGEYTWQMTGTP